MTPTIRTAAVDPDGHLWIAFTVPYTYVFDRDGDKIRTVPVPQRRHHDAEQPVLREGPQASSSRPGCSSSDPLILARLASSWLRSSPPSCRTLRSSSTPPPRSSKIDTLTADAAKTGAKLIVFPEAFVSGYPKGLDFGARGRIALARRAREVPPLLRERHRRARPGDRALRQAAKKHGVYLVIGVIEREVGTLYCTVLFFAPDGTLLGKHRKLMPTAMERIIWGFGDGSTLPVFDTPLGRLGAVICWENYMPMLRMAMYAKGVQLYCAPTADDRDTWLATMQHVALEGRCFVLQRLPVSAPRATSRPTTRDSGRRSRRRC